MNWYNFSSHTFNQIDNWQWSMNSCGHVKEKRVCIMTFLTASWCFLYIPKSIWLEKAKTILCADSHLSGAWRMVEPISENATQQVSSLYLTKSVFIARQSGPSTTVLGIVEYEWTCLHYRSYIYHSFWSFLRFLVCLAYFWESFVANQKGKGKKRQQKKHMTSSFYQQPGGAGRPANGPPPAPFAVRGARRSDFVV